SFVLADGVEVGEAMMENGLLHIDLIQNIPENIVRKIKIKTNQ
ncbi:MAG: heat-shock protein Hsp20, partial [Paracoccaceae bacterium]